MSDHWAEAIAGVIASLLFSCISWLLADARSKARLLFLEDNLKTLKAEHETLDKSAMERLAYIDVRMARSEQDRLEIHRILERLDSVKASKEIVDSFRTEVANLRTDIDRRFDNLERLLTKSM